MKKTTFVLVFLAIGIIAAYFPIRLVHAQPDFNAFYGTPIPDSQIDGKIGDEWNDAGSCTNVPVAPSRNAEVWTKQDGTYLYVGLRFMADSSNPWVAFEFGPSTCMETNADGALFGDDNYSPNGYEDIYFTPPAGVTPDQIQDGKGAISVNASNFVTVELKKSLNSGDTAGKDINWTQGSTFMLRIAFDSEGGGSSGGSSNHANESQIARTILIDANTIPEFPASIVVIGTLSIAIPAILLAKRQKRANKFTT